MSRDRFYETRDGVASCTAVSVSNPKNLLRLSVLRREPLLLKAASQNRLNYFDFSQSVRPKFSHPFSLTVRMSHQVSEKAELPIMGLGDSFLPRRQK